MVIILDLSATFNTVNHDVLLARIEKQFVFCKRALEWFSQLSKTKILQVCVDGKYSEAREL